MGTALYVIFHDQNRIFKTHFQNQIHESKQQNKQTDQIFGKGLENSRQNSRVKIRFFNFLLKEKICIYERIKNRIPTQDEAIFSSNRRIDVNLQRIPLLLFFFLN